MDVSGHKSKKIWLDKGSDQSGLNFLQNCFYISIFVSGHKSWLQDNDIGNYSTNNEENCCYWKIYWNLKEQNLQINDFSVEKCL